MQTTSSYLAELVEAGHFGEINAIYARWLGEKTGAKEEAQLVFLAALFWAARQGHLCLSLDADLFSHFGTEQEKLLEHLKSGSRAFPIDPFVYREGDYFYLQKNWMYETQFLFHLKRLMQQEKQEVSATKTEDLTDEQQLALVRALSCSFSVISGGPGTGKTHTAAKIVEAFLSRDPDMSHYSCGPNRKSSSPAQTRGSLSEKVEISTLHALLGIHRESGYTLEPSPLMADLLIVDECSMVDARLFSLLLAAVKTDTHLVLIGDPYQLPAVENGSLFADLVDLLQQRSSEHLSSLTRCLRSDREEILAFMQSVLQGNLIMRNSEALSFVPLDLGYKEVQKSYVEIQKVAGAHFPLPMRGEVDAQHLLACLSRFALLSCLRKGPFGVDALNRMLVDYFLEKRRGDEHLAMPILITKSSEDLDLFNGELGFLIRHAALAGDYAILHPTLIAKWQLPIFRGISMPMHYRCIRARGVNMMR